MKVLFAIFVLASLLSGCAAQNNYNGLYSKYCSKDSDCVSETVLQPGCSHYCKGDECKEDTRLCEAYYKNSEGNKNLMQNKCIWNEPCKEPSAIECIGNVCVVS